MSRTTRDYSPVGWIGRKAGRDGQMGKGFGYEYWSSRPYRTSRIGSMAKQWTHHIERAMRRECLHRIERLDDERALAELGRVM